MRLLIGRPAFWLVAFVAAALLVPVPVSAQAVPSGMAHEDHPDPGKQVSFALFPDHIEVIDRMRAHEDHPWVTLHELGRSHEDRPILLAEITDPNSEVPVEDRIVTLILTQQHGNEPAGTPAAVDLLDRIVAGERVADHLTNQVLLLLPMANPDGATAEQRRNAEDRDINRDHITLATHEANVIHDVLNGWPVMVAMDHHEYGGQGLGHPSPVRLYDYDLTTLYPVHGNVRDEARQAAMDLMYDGIWPAAERAGFSANEYGETTVNGEPRAQIAGGPDPGILRNHFGLHHVAGLLVETFVGAVENPFHDAERRIAIHATVMDATLDYASVHATTLKQAHAEAKRAEVDAPWSDYLEGDVSASIPDGYRFEEAQAEVLDVLARHGIPASPTSLVPTMGPTDGILLDLRHDLRGHAAAALHPESSRNVAAGQPISLPEPVDDAALGTVNDSPAGGLLLVLLAAIGVVQLMRRPVLRVR